MLCIKDRLTSTQNGTFNSEVGGVAWNFDTSTSTNLTASKDGVIKAVSFERNIGNSGGIYVNGALQPVTYIWDSGNIHFRYHTVNVKKGDSVYVGGNQWYGSNSAFTGFLTLQYN